MGSGSPSAGGDVWLLETSGDKASRLTFDASQENSEPIWSSDGSRIVFGSRRNGKWGLYSKPSNAIGNEEPLVESDVTKMPMSWSPDASSFSTGSKILKPPRAMFGPYR